jgi:hypothetical protein
MVVILAPPAGVFGWVLYALRHDAHDPQPEPAPAPAQPARDSAWEPSLPISI